DLGRGDRGPPRRRGRRAGRGRPRPAGRGPGRGAARARHRDRRRAPVTAGGGQAMPGKVLIVGASGLVGAAAIDRFTAAGGWEVVAVSRRRPETESEGPVG